MLLISISPGGDRSIITETWHVRGAVINFRPTTSTFHTFLWNRWYQPFGSGVTGGTYLWHVVGMDWLYPHILRWREPHLAQPNVGHTLNINAPEAAFRLQRVGAGGGDPIGRVNLPILSDNFFLDPPHRRRVDAAALQTLMNSTRTLYPVSGTVAGATWTSCIFSRRTMTYTPCVAYRMMPSTTRIWQRWRHYPQVPHVPAADRVWYPPRHW